MMEDIWLETNMSLRDFFAGCALADTASLRVTGEHGEKEQDIIAKNAYDQADAMLAARKEQDNE